MTLKGLYRSSSFLDQMPFGPRSWQRDIPQDPVTIAVAAASSATAVATGTAITFGLTSTAAIFAANFAFNAALGYALNALTPKPTVPSLDSGAAQGYQVNGITSAGAIANIYGTTRVGGVVFYQETTDSNKYLHRCIALAGHEVNSISTIYLNDEAVTLNGSGYVTAPAQYCSDGTQSTSKVRILTHLGASDQAADSTLISESDGLWTSNHRARGIAYLYARFEFDADAFPNGVPTVTAIVQGKKVYDPRTSSTAHSANAALCLRDYLISAGIAASSEIDDTLFSTAANICDESVSLNTVGTQARYTTNGTFTADTAPKDAIDNLLRSMGGMIWYSQGKWGCKAAAYTTPVTTLDEDDLRSGLQIQTRHSRRDGFNKVTGIFRGPESNYFQTNYPALESSEFLAADGGLETELELNLPFVDTSQQAQRISKIALYRNREQLRITGSFGMKALQLAVGDLVKITNTRLGFDAKPFEVSEWRFGLGSDMALEVNMTLQEISSGVFAWDADETAFETNNTTLLSPFNVPSVSVTLTQEYRIINEHVTNVLVANIGSGNPERVDYVEVFYKKSTDSDFSILGTGDLGRFEIMDIDAPLANSSEQITYNVKARAISALGVKGSYTSQSKVIEADVTGPSAPTNFSKQLSGGALFLSWDASPDLDLSYYKVHHSSNTSATFGDGSGQVIIQKVARPATSIAYPAISGKFFIEPYDKTGNAGSTASLTVAQSELPVLGVTSTDTENPSFAGNKTNVSVATGPNPDELRMTSFASANSTGTYEFTGYLDTGSARTVRVSSEVTSSRHHSSAVSGSVNWDDIPGTWDSWPGQWDDWTDENQPYGDFSTTVYVSATNDDPSGSPTWGEWVVAAGEATGRAFKFKAVLANTSAKVSPSISVLKGSVEY